MCIWGWRQSRNWRVKEQGEHARMDWKGPARVGKVEQFDWFQSNRRSKSHNITSSFSLATASLRSKVRKAVRARLDSGKSASYLNPTSESKMGFYQSSSANDDQWRPTGYERRDGYVRKAGAEKNRSVVKPQKREIRQGHKVSQAAVRERL
jgi:hypothetical protein